MKNKVKVSLIGFFFTIIFLGFSLRGIIVENNKLSPDESLNYTIQLILSDEIKTLSKNIIDDIQRETEALLSSSINNKLICKSNFVLAYIDAINLKYDEAINKYYKAINLFGNINNPSMKARTYYELSKIYLIKENYLKSNEEFLNMIKLCEKEESEEEIINLSLLRCNDLYTTPEGLQKSIKLLEETLSLASELECVGLVDVYYKLGVLYGYDNRIVESINCKLEALTLAEEKGLKKKVLDINTEIGVDYLYAGNYTEAIRFFKKVLSNELEDEAKTAESRSYALLFLAESFAKVGEYINAEKVFEMLEEMLPLINDNVFREDCRTYMYAAKADLKTMQGNGEDALALLIEAERRYSEKINFYFYNFDIKLIEEYGDAYYVLGDYNKALNNHMKAQKLGKERNLLYLEIEHNNDLYLDYKALGDYDNTIKYLEKNDILKSRVKDDQSRQYSHFLTTKFQRDKNLEKISRLEKYQDLLNALILGLISITITIVVFSCFIIKKNKEISRLNKLFKNLSITDGLTKLPNRRALDEYLSGNWHLYHKTHMPISFVMIDIDYFKNYNDNYGHPQGDKILEEIATSINYSCRNSDFVARYGGEEFIIIMLNTDRHEAEKVVERIQHGVKSLNIKHNYSLVSDRATLSIGISTAYIGNTQNYVEHIIRADAALYKAKEKGRNTYVHIDDVK